MKINDVILLAIYITITFAMTWYVVQDKVTSEADKVLVYSDGEIVKTIPWPADNQQFTVENKLGHMTVKIENGQIDVTDSDCPDKICVNTKAIFRGGEMIVCLPNKIYVEIKKKKNDADAVDGISQ